MTRVDGPVTREDRIDNRDSKGRFGPGNNMNPTGHGGFGTNPQNRSSGKWNKDTSVSYWYNKLGRMDNEEFNKFKPANPFQEIAYKRGQAALSTADGELALKNTKEITDRTEGRAKQDINIDVDEKSAPLIRGFVIPTLPEGYIDEQIAKARAKDKSA